MRVLVAEDDNPLAKLVCKGLEAEHFAVDVASDGREARSKVERYDYDLLIFDLNLPRADGAEVLKYVRSRKPSLPVIVLTAGNHVQDRVEGLELGADDYLSKPFSFSELSARVRALLRRVGRPAKAVLRVEDLRLHRGQRTATRAGKPIALTPKEFALLEFLMHNSGRRVSRAMIMEHVWNLSFDTMSNVVDVYINYLRRKVDEGFEQKLIHTVRGVGYQLGTTKENPA